MNKEEASYILEDALAEVAARSYEDLAVADGQDLVTSATGQSGIDYRVVIQPAVYSEAGMPDWIEVEVTVTEEKRRTWLV